MAMTELQKIEKKIDKEKKKLEELKIKKDNLFRETEVCCDSYAIPKYCCGQTSKIKDLTYIQTHWYVSPSGCTGGDYWNEGEGQFKCPHCDQTNRLYNKPDITKLKYHFKEIVDTQDDR